MKKLTRNLKPYILQGLLTISGGGIMILGIFLPWITFLGGLQTFAGIVGLNGKMLLVSAILSIVFGIILFARKSAALARILSIMGLVQGVFCGYLLFNLFKTVHQVATNGMSGMMAIGLGPGLFLTTLGSWIICLAFFVPSKTSGKSGEMGIKQRNILSVQTLGIGNKRGTT